MLQPELYAPFHEAIVILQRFLMQCKTFLKVIFCKVAFAIDILFNLLLCTSVLDGLTIIFDAFGLNIDKLNRILYPKINTIMNPMNPRIIQILLLKIQPIQKTATEYEEQVI